VGLFSKEKIREEISKEKEKKRISGEACNINKQTVYIAPKSKIESRAHYVPEPHGSKQPLNRTGCTDL